ncbi:MAG: hypothetical protein WCJ31_15025 [Planctomycetia bacterium]
MTAWKSLLVWLAAMSADPDAIERERPKAHASYRVAYATFATFATADEPEPSPQPAPPKPTPRPTRESAVACPCGGACSAACTCGCHGAAAKAAGKCANGTCPLPVESRGSR